MKEFEEMLYESVDEDLKIKIEQENAIIEYTLRNVIDNPIKGEFTSKKLNIIGISHLLYDSSYELIGIIQKNKVFNSDGYIGNIVNGKFIKNK